MFQMYQVMCLAELRLLVPDESPLGPRPASLEQIFTKVQGQDANNQLLNAVGLEDCFRPTDLIDAYFLVNIHPNHRQFLRFGFEGVAYEYLVLPFGLSLTPRTFAKCAKAALALLREREAFAS